MPETTKLPYTTAVGRRKTASARVKVTPSEKTSVTVNGISAEEYFKTKERTSITGDALQVHMKLWLKCTVVECQLRLKQYVTLSLVL
jgi:ribosomal protein S9